jgi:hypothetical protein
MTSARLARRLSIRRLLVYARARFPGVAGAGDTVAAGADRLIARFRDQAHAEAQDLASVRCIDGAGSARYWIRVKLEIARRQNIAIGLSGADLWA